MRGDVCVAENLCGIALGVNLVSMCSDVARDSGPVQKAKDGV